MADSIKSYTGVEATRNYLAPQNFLDNDHIIATVDGVPITQSDELTATTFFLEDQSGSIYAVFGASVILDTFDIVLQRVTPEAALVVFENGSTNQARDLNVAYAQATYIAIEARDLVNINHP